MRKITPRKLLNDKGVRITKYRIAVLDEIMKDTHPSASEIYSAILQKWPTISRTTIYNTLHRLVAESVIEELNVDNVEARYDVFFDHYHGHFYCKSCKQLTDFPITHTLGKVREIAGYEFSSYRIYLQGMCKTCLEQKRNTKSQSIVEE